MTQMLQAIHSKATAAMKIVSKQKNILLTELKYLMTSGQLIIFAHPLHIYLNTIILSRNGALVAAWMDKTRKQNFRTRINI